MLIKDEILQFNVHIPESKYPVEHDRQMEADKHYLHGGTHGTHVLFDDYS